MKAIAVHVGRSEGKENFIIFDEEGNRIGVAAAHVEGDEIIVDWLQGRADHEMKSIALGDLHLFRSLFGELRRHAKHFAPNAKKVTWFRLATGQTTIDLIDDKTAYQ